ncbi:hypothetical protein MHB42_00230 [Lysinibacillus sp. FSL K6-0232]
MRELNINIILGDIFMINTIPVEILEENDEHVIGPKNEDIGF